MKIYEAPDDGKGGSKDDPTPQKDKEIPEKEGYGVEEFKDQHPEFRPGEVEKKRKKEKQKKEKDKK